LAYFVDDSKVYHGTTAKFDCSDMRETSFFVTGAGYPSFHTTALRYFESQLTMDSFYFSPRDDRLESNLMIFSAPRDFPFLFISSTKKPSGIIAPNIFSELKERIKPEILFKPEEDEDENLIGSLEDTLKVEVDESVSEESDVTIIIEKEKGGLSSSVSDFFLPKKPSQLIPPPKKLLKDKEVTSGRSTHSNVQASTYFAAVTKYLWKKDPDLMFGQVGGYLQRRYLNPRELVTGINGQYLRNVFFYIAKSNKLIKAKIDSSIKNDDIVKEALSLKPKSLNDIIIFMQKYVKKKSFG